MIDLSFLLVGYDPYNALWEPVIKSINEKINSQNRDIFLISDHKYVSLQNVTSLPIERPATFSDKIIFGLQSIKTEYVILLLDDYFIEYCTKKDYLDNIIEMMAAHGIVYCRLNEFPKRYKRMKGLKKMRKIPLGAHYSINLQPSIWKKEILEKCIQKGLNPWELEVSFFEKKEVLSVLKNQICSLYTGKEMKILNILLKGRIIPNCSYNLELKSLISQFPMLDIKEYRKYKRKLFAKRITPNFLRRLVKKRLMKNGKTYYSKG